MNSKLVNILKNIGSFKCIEKAIEIEKEIIPIEILELRKLDLSSSDIILLVDYINKNKLLKSISFSYNNSFGDDGANALSKIKSKDITELGLVNCGIGDVGGKEILNWIKTMPQLRMICIEQNNFSPEINNEFNIFRKSNPQTLVVT